ncbi:MAG: hypothetical protein ACOCVF_00575 [bacterium]
MSRPKRKRIKFTEESVNELLQEIYDESHTIKAKIARLFTKWEIKVKEGGEIAAIGDQIIKLIGAEAKNQDQKIMLLKYLKDIVAEKDGGMGKKQNDDEEKQEMTPDRRNELLNMVKKEIDKAKS